MKLRYAVLLLSLLPACAPMQDAINPYEENFKCRAKDDEGKCVDTPSAYKEARFPEAEKTDCPNCPDNDEENDEQSKKYSHAITNSTQLTAQNSRYKVLTELLAEPEKPMLEPPKIMRVLMLPYKGESDELFMPRYVYMKLKESQWILTDINEKARQ